MDSAKLSTKGSKGQATVFEDAGRLKVNLPRQYFGGKQIKKALGLQATPENWIRAERIARRITEDLQDGRFKEGRFEEILCEYGIKTNLVLVPKTSNVPPLPKLDVLEVWEKYSDYIRPNIKESSFNNTFKCSYTSAVIKSVNAVGSDPLAIRNWLLANRCFDVAFRTLSHLSKAYQILVKQGLVSSDPFEGMTDDLKNTNKSQIVNVHDESEENDSNLYDAEQVKKKAFTSDEVEGILNAVKESKSPHYYYVLKFLFLTGCRTNEATALMWGDIKWSKEYIAIQRSYSRYVKDFVTTKTGHTRLFPMPKNGELWNFMESMYSENFKSNQIIFLNKEGKIINDFSLGSFWRGYTKPNKKSIGLIPALLAQGKVSKYLPPYNTRHTFISYQINECGIPPYIVKDWCGHSEDMTTKVYRQEDLLTKPVSYNTKTILNQPLEPSETEVLKQQVQLLMEQNKMLQEIIVNLETKSKASNVEPIA